MITEINELQLKDNQIGFVDLPSETIEIIKDYPNSIPLAIFHKNKLIGFVVYEPLNKQKDDFLIWGFMIDKRFQNKGFGKQSMKKLLSLLKDNFNANRIEIAYVKENLIVKKMYSELGFHDTGKLNDDGEFIMIWEQK